MSKTLEFIPDIDSSDSNVCATNPCYQPEEVIVKPPSASQFEQICTERPPLINLGSLTAEEVRDACLQYASNSCCYGKKFVRETVISNVTNGCTYHYKLESFGEKRETANRTAPYLGQTIDGPENGTPPNPWDIPVTIPGLFMDNKRTFEVPHTAYVKDCWNCVGNCKIRCETCIGVGGTPCGMCGGTGKRNNGHNCQMCFGSGRQRCHECIGTGQVKCQTCRGKGKLKHFLMLIVTWRNHSSDFISDTSKLPKELILEVSGRELFKEQQPKCITRNGADPRRLFPVMPIGIMVYPVNHCPEPAVNQASQTLLMQHQIAFPNELIRMQKQTLRAVPLTIAKYLWRDREGEFYVFGFQNKVYFEKYPQKCCCCTCC